MGVLIVGLSAVSLLKVLCRCSSSSCIDIVWSDERMSLLCNACSLALKSFQPKLKENSYICAQVPDVRIACFKLVAENYVRAYHTT